MLPPVALGDESAGLFATWSLLAACTGATPAAAPDR